MHLEDLERFVCLAELENLTAAAEKLNVSVPAMSRALGRIEGYFGARLFERDHRGLVLTSEGRLAWEAARRATDGLHGARARLGGNEGHLSGMVRLAFLHTAGARLVPDLLARFRETAGEVDFELRQGRAKEVLKDVQSGRADLAITAPRPSETEFGWQLLVQQRLCLALPATHRLAGRGTLGLLEARAERFICVRLGYDFRSVTDNLFKAARFNPDVALETTDFASIDALVAAGLGVAILPDRRDRVGESPGTVLVPLSDRDAYWALGLAWRLRAEVSPAAEDFRRFVCTPIERRSAYRGCPEFRGTSVAVR